MRAPCFELLTQHKRVTIQCAIHRKNSIEVIDFVLQQFRSGLIQAGPLLRIAVFIREMYRNGLMPLEPNEQ
jgi:hypothetical protein